MLKLKWFIFVLMLLTYCTAQPPQTKQIPKVDIHLHTHGIWVGGMVADTTWFPEVLTRPNTDEELMLESIAELRKFNVVKAVGCAFSLNQVEKWKAEAPDVIIPALQTLLVTSKPDRQLTRFKAYFESGRAEVLGEVLPQFAGVSPSDESFDPYFALAEELDIPVVLHMGDGIPGGVYGASPKYRMRLNDPLLLEELLVRHPNLRLCVMHAGWPFGDEMIAILYAYPQVYVDTGLIDWYIPRPAFHAYLKKLVDAGFSKRIIWGTDHMQWPEAIEIAVEAVETADFLTEDQKKDIFYNNAARFLHFSDEEIAKHHGRL